MPITTSAPEPSPARPAAPTTTTNAGYDEFSRIRTPLNSPIVNLEPPTAPKTPTAVTNYQTRWEREKAKARAEGTDIETKDPKMIGPWVLGEMLGRGASGRVRLARHYATGKMAAVKILNLHPHLSSRSSALANAGDKAEKMLLTAEREIAVMKLLDHPNIMKMYDVWSSPKELFLVLEYIQGGELFDYLCSRGSRLPLLEAVSIIKQVLAGVDYCHRFNICHRDLKPENILLTDSDSNSGSGSQAKQVKIADFGMSTLDSLNGLLRTSCGSPHYASPEIVRGQMYSGSASDIWSCGVILYALLTSRLPFDDPNVNNVLRKVRDGKFTIPEWVAPQAKDLLTKMLEVDITKRIAMPEIFAHSLLRMDTPGIILPPVPKVEEIALPVLEEDVDPDLLRNLCIIWREKDRRSMVSKLCSVEKNFEKAFYFLLCRYRDQSFEEYNMDTPLSVDSTGVTSPLPTPLYVNIDVNRVDSPIKRHYPGQHSSKKKAVNIRHTGSPRSSRIRRNSIRRGSISSDKRSPRKSRILGDSTTANSSPTKSPRINSLKSGDDSIPSSRNGIHRISPSPKRLVTEQPPSPRKASFAPGANRVQCVHHHRRASSASASLSLVKDHIDTSLPPKPVVRTMSTKAPPKLSTVTEGNPVTNSSTTRLLDPPNPVPIGIVQQRTSLLTSKLASFNQTSSQKISSPGPKSPLRLTSPMAVSQHPSTPRANRLTGKPPVTPTRLLPKTRVTLSAFGPGSPARTGDLSGCASPFKELQDSSRDYTKSPRPNSNSTTKSSTDSQTDPLQSPAIPIQGLGVFISPTKAPPSPVSNPYVLPPIPGLDEDSTPRSLGTATAHPGTKKTLFDPEVAENVTDGRDDTIKIVAVTRKAGGLELASISADVGRSLSGSSIDVSSSTNASSSERSSGDTGNVSAETWEKLDWSANSSNSGNNGLNITGGKKFKRKPPPLDLFNPYQKDRRHQAPLTPLSETPKKSQSPLLSPFMGFMNGTPSTPPTPSLITSTTGGIVNSSYGLGGGRGLFAKIFDWKSPNLHLLSMESVGSTREECARCLRYLDIAFAPSEYGGFRCRADDALDLHGNHVSKTVRFRIEIEPLNAPLLPTSQPLSNTSSSGSEHHSSASDSQRWNADLNLVPSPHSKPDVDVRRIPKATKMVSYKAIDGASLPGLCTVTFIQEKGAYSMLRIIHQRMQQLWRVENSDVDTRNATAGDHLLTPVSAHAFAISSVEVNKVNPPA